MQQGEQFVKSADFCYKDCSVNFFLSFFVLPYFDSGKVGDWRNHFTPEQQKMFEEDYKQQMKDVDIPFRNLI